MVSVRFHGKLNDFLPPEKRGTELEVTPLGSPSVKDLLESLGPPHPEMGEVRVDGVVVAFGHRLAPGARVEVFPSRGAPEEVPRFILDVGLGRLSGFLRMLGFDTLWRNDYRDDELARVSSTEGRILLTRDIGVLKRGEVTQGYFPRATDPAEQLVEVVRRYGLGARMHPFSRCIACNAPLSPAEPHEVAGRVPEGVAERHSRFQQCPGCRRVFWAGTHQERMQALVDRLRTLEVEEG
ncbi:Mut7-C RNAse domain-containing protein [Myxococcus landrumensis]|uniref:Twitching motility protein PilT n=1 Tax=Myxococcus landrumensis TaxID=2813577 RepID=A0ABX7MZE7_9BACT|nr:Mut7-C RNAse domain-containing protein [Myxococcus landrumus]QSQ11593.1 twitching motility protein PilT [Myxococcus landrumus]